MVRFITLAAVLLLVASAAQADALKLKNGGVIEGVVTEEKDSFVVEVPFGTMKIARDLVDSVTKKDTPLSEHKTRAAALAENDAEGWFKLGQWARAHNLERQAVDDFQRVLAVDPDHAGARAALGYEKVDGKWLSHDEVMAAKGFVKVDGTWVTKEAGALMKAMAEAKLLEAQARVAELRAQTEAEAAARQAAIEERREQLEEKVREGQLALESRSAYVQNYSYPFVPYPSYGSYVTCYPWTWSGPCNWPNRHIWSQGQSPAPQFQPSPGTSHANPSILPRAPQPTPQAAPVVPPHVSATKKDKTQ